MSTWGLAKLLAASGGHGVSARGDPPAGPPGPGVVTVTCHQRADAGQRHVVLAVQGHAGAGGLGGDTGTSPVHPPHAKGGGARSGVPLGPTLPLAPH